MYLAGTAYASDMEFLLTIFLSRVFHWMRRGILSVFYE